MYCNAFRRYGNPSSSSPRADAAGLSMRFWRNRKPSSSSPKNSDQSLVTQSRRYHKSSSSSPLQISAGRSIRFGGTVNQAVVHLFWLSRRAGITNRLSTGSIWRRSLSADSKSRRARKSNVLRIRRNAKLSGTQSILPSLKGYGFIQPIALFLFLTNYRLNQPIV